MIMIIIINISSAPNFTYKALSAYKKNTKKTHKKDNCTKCASQRPPPPHTKQSCNPNITFPKNYTNTLNDSYINTDFATANIPQNTVHSTFSKNHNLHVLCFVYLKSHCSNLAFLVYVLL